MTWPAVPVRNYDFFGTIQALVGYLYVKPTFPPQLCNPNRYNQVQSISLGYPTQSDLCLTRRDQYRPTGNRRNLHNLRSGSFLFQRIMTLAHILLCFAVILPSLVNFAFRKQDRIRYFFVGTIYWMWRVTLALHSSNLCLLFM